MLAPGFYNMDCMDGMREFPDGYFELAIVDPPYGDGGGGFCGTERFGGRFDRYRGTGSTARPTGGGYDQNGTSRTDCEKDKPRRIGGTWAAKFGKKLFRGTSPRINRILTNCSAFHRTRLSGGAITSNYPQRAVF